MKIGTWTVAGASVGALGVALAAPALFGACSSSSFPPAPAAGGGGACATEAGAYPPPNCDDTQETCPAPSPACPVAPCNGSSACLAMADNTGKTTSDLRLRKLNVTAPAALAQHFIQAGVIDNGVNLSNTCGEQGTGSFSWLARFDTTNNKLTTGGAPPSDDPFGKGYCFVNQTIAGLAVAPAVVKMTQGSDGRWASDVIPKLFVPIYINGDPNNVVVLPLSQSKLTGVLLSADGQTAGGAGNCIGSFNPSGVGAPTAAGLCPDEDPSSCERWQTNGSLGGYITLKEANAVNVVTLGKSLCVLLTNGTSTAAGGTMCATNPDGSVTAKGDFCSTTNSPGGCQDSDWLAATFAASAAVINDGTGVAACTGGSSSSGGGDGGTD